MKFQQRINASQPPSMDLVSFDECVDDDQGQPTLNLYLVSYAEFDDDEYDSFVVVACSEEEADQLTPDERMNRYRGTSYMGYDYPVVDTDIRYYRDQCGTGKSIRRIGDAWVELEWGDVPIASFNAG